MFSSLISNELAGEVVFTLRLTDTLFQQDEYIQVTELPWYKQTINTRSL